MFDSGWGLLCLVLFFRASGEVMQIQPDARIDYAQASGVVGLINTLFYATSLRRSD